MSARETRRTGRRSEPSGKRAGRTEDSDAWSGRATGAVFAAVALFVVTTDLVTKWLAFLHLDSGEVRSVIPGLLNFRTSLNRGAVFGWGQGWGVVFIALTILASGVITLMVVKYGRTSRLLTFALGLLLGGALGNLWDRIVLRGVRDFIDVYVGQRHWPTFNVADMAICLGAGLILLYSFKQPTEATVASETGKQTKGKGKKGKGRRRGAESAEH